MTNTLHTIHVLYRYCRLRIFRRNVQLYRERMESYRPRIPIKPQRSSQFLDSTKRNSTRCVP